MRKTILFCALAIVCGVIGCSDETPVGNEPVVEPIPASWDDQSDRDWLYRNQYKQHMRHLWIDSNRVVSAGRGDLEPTWVEIVGAASDIQRRAEMMGGFWSQIVAAGEEIEFCLEDQDRMGTSAEFKALGAACDGCHMATWSPAYLHVTSGTVDRWLDNRLTKHDVNEMDNNPPPTIPNREAMKALFFHYNMMSMRIEQWQPDKMKESLDLILSEARIRVERWKTVASNAAKLVDLANSSHVPSTKVAPPSIATSSSATGGSDREAVAKAVTAAANRPAACAKS